LSFRELPAAAGRSRRMRPLAAIRPNVLADPFPTSSLRGRNAIRLGKFPGSAMLDHKGAPTDGNLSEGARQGGKAREGGRVTTRRDFLNGAGALAGAVFVGCDLMPPHAHAQPAGAPRRREVVVNGRRVKTVDIHAHCAFPEALKMMGRELRPQSLVMAPD